MHQDDANKPSLDKELAEMAKVMGEFQMEQEFTPGPDEYDAPTETSGILATLRDVRILKDNIARLKAELKLVQGEMESKQEKAYTMMENVELQSMVLDHLTFYRSTREYASLKDKEQALEWLENNGFDHLILNTVSNMTLMAELKTFRAEGGEIPDCINVTAKNIIGIRQ